jgi:hypothetical protein
MKRFLAVVCLAMALSGTAQGRPAHIRTPTVAGIGDRFSRWLSILWSHLRILPADGTGTIPPPH